MACARGLDQYKIEEHWLEKLKSMLEADGFDLEFKPVVSLKSASLTVKIKGDNLHCSSRFHFHGENDYTGSKLRSIVTILRRPELPDDDVVAINTFELTSDASLTELLTYAQSLRDMKERPMPEYCDSSSEDEEDNKVYMPYDCSIRGEWFNEGYYSRSELPEDCMDSDGDFIVDDPRLEYFMAESTWNDPGK